MAEELKTYEFPVDNGDSTTTVEKFYLKSDVDERICSLILKNAELEAKLSEQRDSNKDVPANDSIEQPKTPTKPAKPSMKLTEFGKLVHKFLREAPNECYGIDVMYDEFIRHKSCEVDEFIRDYHKQGKTPEQTAEDVIYGLYYDWYHQH